MQQRNLRFSCRRFFRREVPKNEKAAQRNFSEPLGFAGLESTEDQLVFIAAPRIWLVLGRITRGSTCSPF